jgi:hypothetical protein
MASPSDVLGSAQTAPPARVALPRRLALHAGYVWRNSGNPAVTSTRTLWETRGWARYPMVRSDLGGMLVGYAGLREGLAYTLEFTELRRELSPDNRAARQSGSVRGFRLKDPDQLPDTDIVIVGTSAAKARRLPVQASFVMPMRVHFVIDFDEDVEVVLKRIARGEQRNFRQKLRQHEWRLEIERDPAWFDYFYQHIYRATMARRHGERERVETETASYECLFRSGLLFALSMDGKRVAGHLCHWNPRTRVLTSRLLGVVDGAAEYYAAGALKVIHFLLIRWAGTHGVRQLDFQGTEPFLSKGTFQLKRLFGTRLLLPPNHFGHKRLWLHVRRDTPAVRDFLVSNPFLAESADGLLEAVYFYDDERAAREDYRSNSPGVQRARTVSLDGFLAEADAVGRRPSTRELHA